jgi:hypothetical protein
MLEMQQSILTPGVYADPISRLVGILQAIQRGLDGNPEATLDDAVNLVAQIHAQYGGEASLEDTIQFLVGERLLQQFTLRRAARQQQEVAA